jgi:hypothetical protein
MFRFTIRELVLVTAIVALGVGWAMDRHQQSQKHDKEIRHATALRSAVEADLAVERAEKERVMQFAKQSREIGRREAIKEMDESRVENYNDLHQAIAKLRSELEAIRQKTPGVDAP